jgi:hypothetical protein
MSADALSFTLLIILAEFAIGVLWVPWLADLRDTAAVAIVKSTAGLTYDSSRVRAMQSATGLLHIAIALVLSDQILSKGLLFATAVPT